MTCSDDSDDMHISILTKMEIEQYKAHCAKCLLSYFGITVASH